MLYQKIKRFWINIFPNKGKSIALLVLAMLVLCTGCKQNTDEETEEDKTEQQIYEDSQKLAEGYRKIYETAVSQDLNAFPPDGCVGVWQGRLAHTLDALVC